MIQKKKGFGRLKYEENVVRWIVDDVKHTLLLISLFNGHLVIPHRISQLAAAIDCINYK